MLPATIDDICFAAEDEFQWAPTLGGECYEYQDLVYGKRSRFGFNGHPPLGVNATDRGASRRAVL